MIFTILFLLLIYFSFSFPKFFISFLIVFSIFVPATHNSIDVLLINLAGFNFNIIDILFFILFFSIIIKSILLKKIYLLDKFISHITLCFIFFSLIMLLYGLISYNNISQSLYDIRPIFYYFILVFNLKAYKFHLSNIELIKCFFFGLLLFSINTISILYFLDSHPFFTIENSIDDFIKLGRISYQNEYLFLFFFPLFFLTSNKYTSGFIFKFLNLSAFFFIVLKILISMSRGMIILLIVTLPLYLRFNKKYTDYLKINLIKSFKIIFYSTILSISTFILLYFTLPTLVPDFSIFLEYFTGRFTGFNDIDFLDTHVNNRLVMWKAGINEFLKSPIFGHGYGYLFEIESFEWNNIYLSFIDSTYVTIAIRSGFIGLFLLIIIYISIFNKINFKIFNENSFEYNFYKSIKISLIIFFLYSLVNANMIFSLSIFPLLLFINISLKNLIPDHIN